MVELDPASDPVQGSIGLPGESGEPFSGYVQLIAALEGYRQNDGHVEESTGVNTDGCRGERVAS
jgi:hypothetical protein